MQVVVSPAKKLNFDLSYDLKTTSPLFKKETEELVSILKNKSKKDISKLMSLSDSLADLNYNRYQNFDNSDEQSAAGFAFAGDTYKGLQIETFSKDDLSYAKDHLFILSGLYGVLRISDKIKPYRLEMGTRLENERGKNLYEFWSNSIYKKLNGFAKKNDSKYLINLASEEYFKSIDTKNLDLEVIDIKFLENKNGQYKVIGLMSKRARGAMTRYIVQNQIKDLSELKKFNLDGYKFSPKESSANELIFKR